jgi:hypothetical protein
MSNGVKIILIIVGILGFLAIACVGGFTIFAYYFVDHEGITRNMDEGEAFGKTTDYVGCQTKVLEMIKPLKGSEANELVKAEYFFKGCLGTSRPTMNFCDGVPNAYADILNEHKGKDAECKKLGMEGSIACRLVIDEKLDFCDQKR